MGDEKIGEMTSSRKIWELGELGEWDKKGASMEAGREQSQPKWKVATRVMCAVSGGMICDIFDSCHRVIVRAAVKEQITT